MIANNNLYLLPSSTIVNADNSMFIVTNGIGNVIKKSLPLTTDFLFPVGDALTSYKPAILNYTGAIDTFAVRVETGVNPTTGADQTCVQNTWLIEESNSGGTTASLNLGWNIPDEGTSFVDSIALIWQNISGTWTSITGTPGSTNNLPATSWYHVTTGITDFSSTANRFIVRTFPPPVIVKQPVNDTACAGSTAHFDLTAAGMGTLTYQWQENCGSGWSNLTDNATYTGALTNNLDISNISMLNNGCLYQCVVSNAGGSVTTTTATAIVNPVYSISESATICNGQSYSFGGTNYTTAGTYPHTFTSVSGCDSIVTLTLNVNPTYNNTATA
ncbi:MAG: immunoglobulin domain-containing protein, partial [Bacteroidia bacterium]|nr:immunoglobulin domain-containing protein [Bacteroidia bacterium]